MLPGVEEHVDEGPANLCWRGELMAMMAVTEEAAGPPRDPVHSKGDPREEQLHPACELAGVVGFDDEVQVIVLDRVVEHADAARRRERELVDDRREDALRTEARTALHALHRDVHGMPRVVRRSRDVRHEADTLRPRPATEPLPATSLSSLRSER